MKRARRAKKKRSMNVTPAMDKPGSAVEQLAAHAAALRIEERPANDPPTSCPLPSTTVSSASATVPTSKKTKRRPRMRSRVRARSPVAHQSPVNPTTQPQPRPPAQQNDTAQKNDTAQQLYAKVVRVCKGNPVINTASLRRAGCNDVPAKIMGMLLAIPSILPRLLADDVYLKEQILACVGVLHDNIKTTTSPQSVGTKSKTPSSDASSTTSHPSQITAPPLPTQEQLSASSPELWRRLVGPHLHVRVQRLVNSVRDLEGLLTSKPLADKITGMLLDCTDRKRVEASLRDNQLLRHDFDSALKVLRRARDSTAEPPASISIPGPVETQPNDSQSVRSDSDSPQPEERTVGSLTFTVVPPRRRKTSAKVSLDKPRDESLAVKPRIKPTLNMTPTTMLAPAPAPAQALTPTSSPPNAVCSICGPRGTWMLPLQMQCGVCGRGNSGDCQTIEDSNDGTSVEFSARTIDTDEMLTAAEKVEDELDWLQVRCETRKVML